jgi:16S rRNA C1402 N4-methylase RsmH
MVCRTFQGDRIFITREITKIQCSLAKKVKAEGGDRRLMLTFREAITELE